jgi:putative transposase
VYFPVFRCCVQDGRGFEERLLRLGKARPPSKRSREDAALTEKHRENLRSPSEKQGDLHGYPRVHAESYVRSGCVAAWKAGSPADAKSRAARVHARGRKKRTTRRDPRAVPAADLVKRNLVKRNFCATAPDKLCTADIHLLENRRGLLIPGFRAGRLHSRRIVGWSMAVHLYAPNSWWTPCRWRCGGVNLKSRAVVHHSDRGVQCTRRSPSARSSKRPGDSPLAMGRAAQAGPGDNAISESFVSTLKCELVHGRRFPTREAARSSAVFEYLEARSTTVGDCTPRSAT